jgi:hypothetical protein
VSAIRGTWDIEAMNFATASLNLLLRFPIKNIDRSHVGDFIGISNPHAKKGCEDIWSGPLVLPV